MAPCVACGAGVWRAGAAPSRVCGGWLRLVLQVRVSCVVLCRSVPRRVASCCGALHCGALWCGVPWSRVVPRWVSGGQPGLCRGAECGPECGWLAAGVRLGVGLSLGPCCGGSGVPLGLVGRVGRSLDGPWGCPPWGPVPWSRVLWGFRSLVLAAVAVPSSYSGACEVALVVAGVVAWR